jgi:DNA-directed RNA polymerase subunit alpha
MQNSLPPLTPADNLEVLGIAGQACNVLRASGILTIGDLLGFTEQQLLKTPGLGRKSVKQIKERLKQSGIELQSVFIRKGALLKWDGEPSS